MKPTGLDLFKDLSLSLIEGQWFAKEENSYSIR